MNRDFELLGELANRDMKKEQAEFAICVANEDYEDLEIWKVYRIMPDPAAAEVACLRVIDESGEDYLYPANRFVQINFPGDVRKRLLASVDKVV